MEARSEDAAGGRRARKKAQTRQTIYEAAMRLFIARGYDAVTVDDVCRAADVAKGTFFLHFPSKDGLLAEYGREAVEELRERVAAFRGGAAGALRLVFQTLSERADRHPEIVRLTVRETIAHPASLAAGSEPVRGLGALVIDLVRRGQAAGELRRGLAPEVAGAVLVGAYFAIVNTWALGGERFDLPRAVDQALKIVLTGLRKELSR